jgi:hypothetical protein
VALTVAFGARSADAAQIKISATVNWTQAASGNWSWDFIPVAGGNGVVQACCAPGDLTGVFSVLPLFLAGVNADLVFGTGAIPTPTALPVQLVTIGGFTFTATSFGAGNTGTPITLTQGNPTTAAFHVNGFVTGPGINGQTNFTADYVMGLGTLTIVQVQNLLAAASPIQAGVTGTFTTDEATPVPEPATGLLMLAGVGVAAVRRRRR